MKNQKDLEKWVEDFFKGYGVQATVVTYPDFTSHPNFVSPTPFSQKMLKKFWEQEEAKIKNEGSDKDSLIAQLRNELHTAHSKNEELIKINKVLEDTVGTLVNEKKRLERELDGGLRFPADFESMSDIFSVKVEDEDIQKIITELEGVEVEMFSFVSHRIGNVLITKFNDDEGIHYVVAEDYYCAKEKE